MIGEQNPDPPLADAKSTQLELLKPVLKKIKPRRQRDTEHHRENYCITQCLCATVVQNPTSQKLPRVKKQ
jgi:hypothetical protein